MGNAKSGASEAPTTLISTQPHPPAAPEVPTAPVNDIGKQAPQPFVNDIGWVVVGDGPGLPTTVRAELEGGTLYAVQGAGVVFIPKAPPRPALPAPAPAPPPMAGAPVPATVVQAPVAKVASIVADDTMFHQMWEVVPTLRTPDDREKVVNTVSRRIERRALRPGWYSLKNILGKEARENRASMASSWQIDEASFEQMSAQILHEAGWALELRAGSWFLQLV